MNVFDVVILALLAGALFLAVRSLARAKACGCSGCCGQCARGCHTRAGVDKP